MMLRPRRVVTFKCRGNCGGRGQGNRKDRESASEKCRHQENQKRKGETKIDGGKETKQKETR
jgi:hypothetical protein